VRNGTRSLIPGDLERREEDRKILEVFEKVELGALVQRGEGLDQLQNWDDTLSGGEKQRVAMARLLFHNPKWAPLLVFQLRFVEALYSSNDLYDLKCVVLFLAASSAKRRLELGGVPLSSALVFVFLLGRETRRSYFDGAILARATFLLGASLGLAQLMRVMGCDC
jgi:hypothetical protein